VILSVVIPTRDKRELLERTLRALRVQQPGVEEWEIVVVDDGSRDDTGVFLRDLTMVDPRLCVVRPPHNVGRAAARNLGWRRATGRWVVFLDDDILAPPGLLRAHLELFARADDIGTIGAVVTDPDIVDAPHFRYLDTRGVAKLPPGPAPGKYFVTQNAGVPRQALARIGGFDESYAAYGFEDMDLGFRLEDAGIRFRVLPGPVPRHIHHHTLAAYLEKKRICGRASLRQVAARHPQRLAEMRLDWIVDPPRTRAPVARRLIRRLLRHPIGPLVARIAASWPTVGARAVAEQLYFRCLDAAVMAAYCQGLADPALDSAIMAQ